MNLQLDFNLAGEYTSNSQIARVITEEWVGRNMFCPNCGHVHLKNYENNRKVADFCCENCGFEYELKSKNGIPGNKINDGAYQTMIERLNSLTNPSLFFLGYNKKYEVENFFVIPKYFFTPDIIEKRKPLADTARRAGWTGCNILYSKIPKVGIIEIIKNKNIISPEKIIEKWGKTVFLNTKSLEARGWTLEILKIVQDINKPEFSLDDVYKYEFQLSIKFPQNNFIKDKIRQQLQILRDKKFIEFIGKGKYKLI